MEGKTTDIAIRARKAENVARQLSDIIALHSDKARDTLIFAGGLEFDVIV